MTVPAPYVYNATVTRVIDGDTIEADIDFGFRRHDVRTPVRILGINARELSDDGGPEARDNLAALLHPGAPVVLHTVKPDKYQPRWVAAIETPEIADLSAHLIATGWAAEYWGYGPKRVPDWPIKTDTGRGAS